MQTPRGVSNENYDQLRWFANLEHTLLARASFHSRDCTEANALNDWFCVYVQGAHKLAYYLAMAFEVLLYSVRRPVLTNKNFTIAPGP